MKLTHVTIHNFRSIIEVDVNFHPYTLLVGANNAGKSTIIDCIRAFYEKDGFKYKKDADFPLAGAVNDESWVELTFILSNDEDASLKDEYRTPDRHLKVRKYFQTNEKLDDNKSASGSILGYKADGTLSNTPFYGAKNVQNGKFGDLIYIPAVSKVDEHTKLSGPSALRDLITGIMSDVVEGSDAYRELTTSVNAFAGTVRAMQTSDKRSLSGFETELNGMLEPWQTDFKLRFSVPTTPEIIKSMLGWDIRDVNYEKPQPIDHFGSGFQRHFIYSLIQLGAKYVSKKAPAKDKDFAPTLNLVLFEEPEAFLHPTQQDELARNLVAVSEGDGWQIAASTHSPRFVSRNSSRIPAIIHLDRKDKAASTYQIDDTAWSELVDANHAINQVATKYPKVQKTMEAEDLKPEMEAVKYFLWLNPDRAGVFFAQQVLLVEGPTETALINKLCDDGKLQLPWGTYVLDCLGKYNIHRFMNLLAGLGITHAVIHDDDENRDEHQELNQLIADAKNPEFTSAIVQIQKDIESFLGVPPPGSSHRKPQHMLYRYGAGLIDSNKLDAFCALVQACFPHSAEG